MLASEQKYPKEEETEGVSGYPRQLNLMTEMQQPIRIEQRKKAAFRDDRR
ncbi:hypothetical protein ACFS07_11745 [Undibacterium arcticum]